MKQQTSSDEKLENNNKEPQASFITDSEQLAHGLFRRDRKKREIFLNWLRGGYAAATGKDFLVVHSPGGWGNTPWDTLLDWEKSIVTGVTSALGRLGYSYDVIQYLRSGKKWWGHIPDVFRDARFFTSGNSERAKILAKGIRFLVEHLPGTRIILVGASQGAAFNNAVVKNLEKPDRVFSFELGTFFPYMKHRVVTANTLTIDNNGLQRDPMCERDLWAGVRSYYHAVFRWLKYRREGHPKRFTHCIATPGHEYHWDFPAVHTNITQFIKEKCTSLL